MNIVKSVKECYKKYFCFSGKASRSEYWWFFVFSCILLILIQEVIEPRFQGLDESFVYLLFFGIGEIGIILIPLLSVGSRRLRDTGRSGWWILLYPLGITLTYLGILGLLLLEEDRKFIGGVIFILGSIINVIWVAWLSEKSDVMSGRKRAEKEGISKSELNTERLNKFLDNLNRATK